jgi:hypothetical protein
MSSKNAKNLAASELERRDWSDAEVVTERGPVSVVHSTRLPAQWSRALEAEAVSRGVNPSQLMKDLIIAGLQQADARGTVTISPSALHQAIDAVLRSAA